MRLSYSSINTYETCRAKFKFQYEDRIDADLQLSVYHLAAKEVWGKPNTGFTKR